MALSGSSHKSSRYGTSMKFVIPSDFARSRDVQVRILDEIEKNHYNSDCVFAIKLALEEAMVNAVKHGNKLDPLKKVYVEALVGPTLTEIIIEDEGPGFSRTEVPDPTAVENLEKCSGRGILLIEAYMSTAEWTNNGRRLHMTKRND
ncbi:MAG TPA: ATP-binding protein [Tepidisphaeraceae bacterium]|jgi:serine/threonine-protein kinase RsbW